MSYASHIGRVGALAVALGVGIAVATTPGIAFAQTDTDTVTTDDATPAPAADETPADDPGTGTPEAEDDEVPADEDLSDDLKDAEDETPLAGDDEKDGELTDADLKSDDKKLSDTDDDAPAITTLSDSTDDNDAAFANEVLRSQANNAAEETDDGTPIYSTLKSSVDDLLTSLSTAATNAGISHAAAPTAATARAKVVNVVSDLMSSLAGLGAGTGSPLDGTLLFSVLAFARREFEPLVNLTPFAAPTAALALGNGNLLLNPGGETATPTQTGFSATTVPGWTTVGTPAVIPYGLPRQYPSPLEIEFPAWPAFLGLGFPDAPAGGGNNFFGGGAQSTTAIKQTVEFDAATQADINGGGVSYDLSALLGGFTLDPSAASVTVNFKDAGGASLGTGEIGPVSIFDRGFQTQLLEQEISGTIPVNTTSAEVVVNFKNSNPALIHYNNAYADNISFSVSSGFANPGMLTPPAPWAGAGQVDHVFVVYMENKGYSEIRGPIGQIDPRIDFPFNPLLSLLGPFGQAPYVYFGAPYLNLLANGNTEATNYHGLMHPSNINYVATLAGTDDGLNSNCFHQCTDAPSLVDNVDAAGLTWAGYAQGDVSPYQVGVTGGLPFNAFNNIYNNPDRASQVHSLDQLQIDLQLRDGTFAATPNFVWIAADDAHNMEGPTKGENGILGESGGTTGLPLFGELSLSPETTLWLFNKVISWTTSQLGLPALNGGIGWTTALGLGIAQYNVNNGNLFLEQNLQTIYHSDVWNDPTQSCVIFVTFDEDNDNLSIGDGNEGQHVYFSAIGNDKAIADGFQTGGVTDDANYNHYNLTRTIEDALGLPYLTDNDRYAQPMNGLWS